MLFRSHLTRYRARWRFFSELGRVDAEGHEEPYEASLAADATPAVDLETADRQARLEASLQGLPAHQRVPLVLFHFEQYSYQAIAEALGVSLGKVKTDIHRARATLKKKLQPKAEELGV